MESEAAIDGVVLDVMPTRHLLRAAIHVAKVLDPDDGTPLHAAHHAYTELPTGGIYQSRDLLAAEGLLIAAGLVSVDGGTVLPSPELCHATSLFEPEALESLLLLLLETRPPVWLPGAVSNGEVRPESIPDEHSQLLGEIIPDLARREAILLAAARRHDASAREAVGELGEELVAAECKRELIDAGRPELAGRVRRVSLDSDQLGWDVDAPTLGAARRKLEVKTTRSTDPMIRFYLSRNEARVGQQDPEWSLVFCRAGRDDAVQIVGWCRMDAVLPLLPSDQHARGCWESAILTIDQADLHDGLTPAQ